MSLETLIYTFQREIFKEFHYLCIRIEATLSKTYEKNKKRYALL